MLERTTSFGSAHQDINPVDNPPRRVSKLDNSPVVRIVFSDIVGPSVVDEPFGERGMQHRHCTVGRRPSVVGIDLVKADFDIPACDGVKGSRELVAKIALRLTVPT